MIYISIDTTSDWCEIYTQEDKLSSDVRSSSHIFILIINGKEVIESLGKAYDSIIGDQETNVVINKVLLLTNIFVKD